MVNSVWRRAAGGFNACQPPTSRWSVGAMKNLRGAGSSLAFPFSPTSRRSAGATRAATGAAGVQASNPRPRDGPSGRRKTCVGRVWASRYLSPQPPGGRSGLRGQRLTRLGFRPPTPTSRWSVGAMKNLRGAGSGLTLPLSPTSRWSIGATRAATDAAGLQTPNPRPPDGRSGLRGQRLARLGFKPPTPDLPVVGRGYEKPAWGEFGPHVSSLPDLPMVDRGYEGSDWRGWASDPQSPTSRWSVGATKNRRGTGSGLTLPFSPASC